MIRRQQRRLLLQSLQKRWSICVRLLSSLLLSIQLLIIKVKFIISSYTIYAQLSCKNQRNLIQPQRFIVISMILLLSQLSSASSGAAIGRLSSKFNHMLTAAQRKVERSNNSIFGRNKGGVIRNHLAMSSNVYSLRRRAATTTKTAFVSLFRVQRQNNSNTNNICFVRPVRTETTLPFHKRNRWYDHRQYSNRMFLDRKTAQTTLAAINNNVPATKSDATTALHDDSNEDSSLYDDEYKQEDTIYALATGSGNGSLQQLVTTAIAIIRMTGPQSLSIVQQLCRTKVNFLPRKTYLRKLYHPVTNEILDEVIIIYYQKPFSYTGEDCIEIQCHGSRAVIQDIFNTIQHPYFKQEKDSVNTIRMAEPGEFTHRAYNNGKMDLLQIEALSDLLQSETSEQRKQALVQYDGSISDIYNGWRQQLIAALAHAEAIIDFGDDEVLEENDDAPEDVAFQRQKQQVNIWGRITNQMQDLIQQMEYQIHNERRGELVRDGVKIAIIGPPNVGKSSLMNILSYRDAAIVSNIAGTTRDIVEVPMNLNGIKCVLQDTAGVRTTPSSLTDNDMIEQIGINRAIQAAQKADIVLAVIDSTDISTGWSVLSDIIKSPSDNNVEFPKSIDQNHILVVYNKADLNHHTDEFSPLADNLRIDHELYNTILNDSNRLVNISCTTNNGIDLLLQALTQRVMDRVHGSSLTNDEGGMKTVKTLDQPMITRTRHRQHILASIDALQRFVVLSKQGSIMIDMAAEELRLAASELGRITGAVDVEDILDKLFADFCIGK